jgi:hypothetical protein
MAAEDKILHQTINAKPVYLSYSNPFNENQIEPLNSIFSPKSQPTISPVVNVNSTMAYLNRLRATPDSSTKVEEHM